MSTSYKLALIDEYASISRALASPHRLRLLEQLAQGEKGVDALAEGTALTFANCSQHLQELRRVGLVTSRREGKAVIYRLTDDDTLRLMAGTIFDHEAPLDDDSILFPTDDGPFVIMAIPNKDRIAAILKRGRR